MLASINTYYGGNGGELIATLILGAYIASVAKKSIGFIQTNNLLFWKPSVLHSVFLIINNSQTILKHKANISLLCCHKKLAALEG